MRLFATFITALLVLGAGKFVYAADEFGERFGGQSPTALRESSPADETAPADIEPAAGDETTPADTTDQENDSTGDDAVEPEAGDTREGELEQKMGTEVQSTTQDLGDGQVKQHDSVGDGSVRAFYRSEQDGRVMDTNDAAGVEVKVLDFK